MAKIFETTGTRRTIKLSADDVIAIIKQYQVVTKGFSNAIIVRDLLENAGFYLPEDIS